MISYETKPLLQQIAAQLFAVYHDHDVAQHKAQELLAALTKKDITQLLIEKTLLLSDAQHNQLAQWITKITVEHMPLEYAIGEIPFLSLMLTVQQPVLIPRPETEAWCAELIAQLQKSPPAHILDVCTGSGALALALAHAFRHARVDAIDNAPHALKLAQINALRNNITNISIISSDLYDVLPQQRIYDLIVANPPYISAAEWEHLDPSVKNWEDPHALVAPEEGLLLIKTIIDKAPLFLKKDGSLWVEIGHTQGAKVKEFFTRAQFDGITIFKDIHRNDRVVYGILKH